MDGRTVHLAQGLAKRRRKARRAESGFGGEVPPEPDRGFATVGAMSMASRAALAAARAAACEANWLGGANSGQYW